MDHEETPRRKRQEPEPEPEVKIKELTIGPFKGRKYVILPDGRLGPRYYDDVTKEKP